MGFLSKLFKTIEPVTINLDGSIVLVHNKQEAIFYAKQLLRIVNDCARLVNTTKKPKVFFERYELLLKYLDNMARLEKFGCFKGSLPSQDLKETLDKKIYTINDFIDRYYNETLVKINNLRTSNAKNKKAENFYSQLLEYNNSMLPDNIKKYEIMYKNLLNKK